MRRIGTSVDAACLVFRHVGLQRILGEEIPVTISTVPLIRRSFCGSGLELAIGCCNGRHLRKDQIYSNGLADRDSAHLKVSLLSHILVSTVPRPRSYPANTLGILRKIRLSPGIAIFIFIIVVIVHSAKIAKCFQRMQTSNTSLKIVLFPRIISFHAREAQPRRET